MSQSIRFLGLAVFAWAGVRAVSLGMVPGMEAWAFDLPAKGAPKSSIRLPAVQPNQLPAIEPLDPAPAVPPYAMAANSAAYPAYGSYPPYAPYIPYPIYVPVPTAAPHGGQPQIIYLNQPAAQPPAINVYGAPPAPGVPEQKLALAEPVPQASIPQWRSTPSVPDSKRSGGLDRLSLSGWAMMRDQPGAQSLAGGGMLGGSQAGARLLWRFDPHLAASLRTSTPINSQRGGEFSLGARYQPFVSLPVALTLERRQSIGRYGGRNAFAALAEGGLYAQSLPWRSTLDAYVQAGIVGAKRRDWFVDGSAAVTRPVWRNFSAGFGVWGGAQPGLNRLDAGPRASMRVNDKVRVHVDYRKKLLGNAAPGSGGVVTLAGDF